MGVTKKKWPMCLKADLWVFSDMTAKEQHFFSCYINLFYSFLFAMHALEYQVHKEPVFIGI